MRFFLTLVLLLWGAGLRAQAPAPPAVFTDAAGRCQLRYASPWQLQKRPAAGATATFRAGDTAATATLRSTSLPDDRRDRRLLGAGRPDSVLRRIQGLPLVHIVRLDQRAGASFEEVAYDYSYGGTRPGARTHVLGRQLWRGGYEFRVEYRARASHDSTYLAAGQALLASFAFSGTPWASRRYDDQLCDGKMYGIAALRTVDGHKEDDCRSIHEFVADDPTAAPRVHRRVLPFQSYALAKGFDNCLYSVTKAPTDAPERVYRYNPATRQGAYTAWQLPAQGQQILDSFAFAEAAFPSRRYGDQRCDDKLYGIVAVRYADGQWEFFARCFSRGDFAALTKRRQRRVRAPNQNPRARPEELPLLRLGRRGRSALRRLHARRRREEERARPLRIHPRPADQARSRLPH